MTYIRKIFVSSLILLSMIFSFPQSTHAGSFILVSKEFALDAIAWNIANTMLRKVTAQTVNWINSGFQGSPAYVRNPNQFFLSVADQEASRFLSGTELNALCSPFRAQVRLALVRNHLDDQQNFSCSLGILRNNYDQFMGDFSQGGWDGWFELTQNDQNNPIGAYRQAQNRLTTNIGNQQIKFQDQLKWSGGFLSWETCPEGLDRDPSDGQGDCWVEKQTNTPGKLIADTLHTNVSIGTKRLEASDEIDEVISALFNQLTERLVGGIGRGLFGASNPGTGQTKYTTDLENEQPPPPPVAPPPQIPPCPTDLGYICDGDVLIPPPPPTPGGGTPPASLLSQIQAERGNYGTPMTHNEAGSILNLIAWNNRGAGWGLSFKDFGEFCPSPAGPIACDILYHQPTNTLYDVFIDVEGNGTPTWNNIGINPHANRPWVAPVQP